MNALVILCLVGVAFSQFPLPTDRIRQTADALFGRLDHSPQDNVVTQAEWDAIVDHDDKNKDGCVTLDEYKQATHIKSDQLKANLFHQFDHDQDGCMKVSDMNDEYTLMDASGDGNVTMTEFENHMIDIITKAVHDLFSHGGGLIG